MVPWQFEAQKILLQFETTFLRTRTAPSPLNLATSWIPFIGKACKSRSDQERKTGVMRLFAGHPFTQVREALKSNRSIISTNVAFFSCRITEYYRDNLIPLVFHYFDQVRWKVNYLSKIR